MKRMAVAILSLILIILCSCKAGGEKKKISLITPGNAPYISTLNLGSDYKVSGNAVASDLPTYFASGEYDVIVAPVNLGAKLYKASKSSYRMLGVVTWGNLYIASLHDFDKNSIPLNVKAFGSGTINQSVLEYTFDGVTFTYPYNSTDDAGDGLLKGEYVVVAEPTLSNIISRTSEHISYVSVNDIYKDKTSSDGYPQAGVFVRGDLDDTKLGKIRNDFKKSCESIDAMASKAYKNGMFDSIEVAKSAIANSNIVFKDSLDAKESVLKIMDLMPTMFGGRASDEFFI